MAKEIKLKVKKLNPNAIIPTRGTEKSSGLDLFSLKRHVLASNNIVAIETGIAIELPKNHFGLIAERSGFSLTNGLVLKAGVIDEDYRGEIKVILQNASDYPVTIPAGQKFAQLLILPNILVEVIDTDKELSETERGTAGFGSTDSTPLTIVSNGLAGPGTVTPTTTLHIKNK